MKHKLLISFSTLSLLAAVVMPVRIVAQQELVTPEQRPVHYTVSDLGPPGNPFSQATWLNDIGLVTGFYTAADGTSHANFWFNGMMTDISKPGLGGPNSGAGGVNELGQVIAEGETSFKDPNNENFCGYPTGLQCLAFLWRFGRITPLKPLGGTNSGFGMINNLGEVAGFAETSRRDSECRPGVSVNGTGPQVLDYEAVIWGPWPGEIRELRPLPGDTVGMAFGINDYGQAVGTSGRCGNVILPPFAGGPHALLWDNDGSVHNLGSLGGTIDPTVLGSATIALAVNNQAHVTGAAALPGNSTFHPFLWTKKTGMRDLGVLPGDLVGAGLGMNNKNEIVGSSSSAPGLAGGNPRAFLWRNGILNDLNALVQNNPPMYMLVAFAINDFGAIAGFGVVTSGADAGEIHGFLATPCGGNAGMGSCEDETVAAEIQHNTEKPKVVLTENARKLLLRRGLSGHRQQ